jgi:hypothetical protein
MSTQYRLVQSGKTASGGCSASPRFVRACSATGGSLEVDVWRPACNVCVRRRTPDAVDGKTSTSPGRRARMSRLISEAPSTGYCSLAAWVLLFPPPPIFTLPAAQQSFVSSHVAGVGSRYLSLCDNKLYCTGFLSGASTNVSSLLRTNFTIHNGWNRVKNSRTFRTLWFLERCTFITCDNFRANRLRSHSELYRQRC